MDKQKYNKQYREKHKEEIKLHSVLYYAVHGEEVRAKAKERSRLRRLTVPEEVREQDRLTMLKWRRRNKLVVLSHYGRDGNPICVKCGENRTVCLSIDHINGKGNLDRKQRGVGGHLYFSLIKEGFPSGFQTLCMNCQWVKRFENNENSKKDEKFSEE